MKIKVLAKIGKLKPGDIVDAAVASDKQRAFAWDDDNVSWYLTQEQFEILEEQAPEITWKPQEIQTTFVSLREIIGQDLARIEFK